MTPTGFDSSDATNSQGNNLRNSEQSRAAQGGAAASGTGSHAAAIDPDLQDVVEAWPRLSAEIKAQVLALIAGEEIPPTRRTAQDCFQSWGEGQRSA